MAVTSQARVDQPVRLFGCSHQGDQCLIKHALPAQRIFERPRSLADMAGVRSAHLTAVSVVTWLGASAVQVNERYRVKKIDDKRGQSTAR